MGTRARVNIFEGDQMLVSIYCQFDGYPSGLGQDVAKFAAQRKIINGIRGQTEEVAANGMGCFAAQLIKHLKQEIGNVYIRDTSDESHGEEYSYNITEKEGKIWINAYEGSTTFFGLPGDSQADMTPIFSGFASDFDGDKIE